MVVDGNFQKIKCFASQTISFIIISFENMQSDGFGVYIIILISIMHMNLISILLHLDY